MSDDNKNIYAAFVKAQAGFGPALKTSTNPHFRSRYAALDACIEAVIDSLHANGIALLQKTHKSDGGVTVETVFIHTSGESFSGGELHVPASKEDPQGYGSALTYCRRYSLMAACGIASEDDDGNAASKKKPEPEKKADAPKAEGEKKDELGITPATFNQVLQYQQDEKTKPIVDRGLAYYKVTNLLDLTEKAGRAIIKKVKDETAAAAQPAQ